MRDPTALDYRERRPSAALGPLIECLWLVRSPIRVARRPPEHIVPDACPELIVHLADPFSRRIGARWTRQPLAFLAGTLSCPWILRAGPHVRTLGIRFRPGAVTSFFAIDMRSITDREVPLPRLVGKPAAAALVTALRAARSRADCFRIAERWLHARRRPQEASADLTRRVLARILEVRGRERIEAVARDLGIPRRRIERCFMRHLGIRPKLFARIVRLQAALEAIGRDQRANAVDVALGAGYFDQAHLSRDFRAVAGRRASASRAMDGPLARHFSEPDRLLAFLAGE